MANGLSLRYERAMAPKTRIRVHVLALVDCTAFVPVGVMDLLRKSVELAATMPGPHPDVVVKLVSAGDRVLVNGAGGLGLRCGSTLPNPGPAQVIFLPPPNPDPHPH